MLYLTLMTDFKAVKNLIETKKQPTKEFFLDLMDGDKQIAYENAHIQAVMAMLRFLHIGKLKAKLASARAEKEEVIKGGEYDAERYKKVLELNAKISSIKAKMQEYKPFFEEPYFARMDLTDDKEGYNSYYIGKHGSEGLEIVDWRAPLARKYYQKSKTSFSINEYDYKLILRRALRTKNGKVLDFKNEYLSLGDYLSKEEIAGRDEALIFDPFLKEILRGRKEKQEICDIIETIQEKQFEIITLPERDEFVLQGVAGSGKTMILLHRLSYIMYNNESLRPTDVMVITPSDSFNAFIDELSAVLELEKVKTSTLDNYFLKLLKSVGVDFTGKIDYNAPVDERYLKYIYSPSFEADVEKKLSKIFDGVYGLFASDDCKGVAEEVAGNCEEQIKDYEKIKNASVRIRRSVLGEIKEKKDGGLYYTKQFRYMFNCVLDVKEFLRLVESDERMKDYAYFYRQFLSFYKSIKFLRRYSRKICLSAEEDLSTLERTVDKEISDLKRYKLKTAEGEVLTYSQGIEKREELKREIGTILNCVKNIESNFFTLHDFADVIRGESYLVAIGKCESVKDILRFFYKETVKKAKLKHSMGSTPYIKSDLFALCLILTKLGFNLSPKFSFIFVDEAQDISPAEYGVLRAVNDRAVFNIFGDLKQNITPYRGIKDWKELNLTVYNLSLNYRNTNEIVDFVSKNLGIEMTSIGFDGFAVEEIPARSVTGWLSGKNGLKAVICGGQSYDKYDRKSYNRVRETGKISKTKINIMTVYESKGLEFTAVAVADADMSDNEKYIAYTRALKELAIIKD
ncbi:MAG: UvrD-helicase domain-containing protein [Clostridia bacterium]|nr:UvrD-helicase domain-containing protein [Clostridia bacterium]